MELAAADAAADLPIRGACCLSRTLCARAQWADEENPTLILHSTARKYLRGLEARRGQELSHKDMRTFFEEQNNHLEKLTQRGPEQIRAIRSFVKAVGPIIGKSEWGADGPLHEVLLRADEILGLATSQDQDLHPFLKGGIIMEAIRDFNRAVISIHEDGSHKDEL